MGLFDRFRKQTAVDTYSVNNGDFYGAWKLSNEDYLRILGLSPGDMWRTQPYLRTVVTFMARNIAQLGLQTFERVGETDRRRVRDGALNAAIRRPNRATTSYELIYGLVADLALHDAAYWLLSDDPDQQIVRLPVDWVKAKGGDALAPAYFEVRLNDKGESAKIPADQILAFHGWHPSSLYGGSSPLNALREILAEQVQASKYREMTWRRGGKVGSVLSRPAGAPEWSPEAREQFRSDWDANYTGNGPKVGGTPMLEDGMELRRVDFSATEMQFIEGSRLALNTCASVYHINPTMIGLLDNANYSNVREFRKMLYGDTLGPVIAQIEDRLNGFLVPRLDSRPNLYVEFNIEEKLQGNFEEQTTALQSSVGAPWMTTNEARAIRNMPAIAGGDDLVVPLNVIKGGQASPTDSAPPKASSGVLLKAAQTERQKAKAEQVFAAFFGRQAASVLGKLGAKDGGDWWDGARWDKELAADLLPLAHSIAETIGKAEAERLGFSDAYNGDQTVNFLKAVAARYAKTVNETTKAQLDTALEAGNDPADVFTTAKTARAAGVGFALTTFATGFGTVEAAKQVAQTNNVEPTKTWITGSNPRPEHSAMDGETVPVDDVFSNGEDWPGGLPGCNCSVSTQIP